MVNTGLAVINNGHGESVCLVSSLCFNRSPHSLWYTRMAKGELSFSVMLTGEYVPC